MKQLKLLGDWRLRVSNSNNDNFENPARIYFRDANTTADKEVFADIEGKVSLGAYVDLDNDGYVGEHGIWLDVGAYSATIQVYSYTDNLGNEVYQDLWTIPYILGSEYEESFSGMVRIFDNISNMRSLVPDDSTAYVLGYYSPFDGGGGWFDFDNTSILDDDLGSAIIPNSYSPSQQGRWIRLFNDTTLPNVKMWGAIEGQPNVKVNIEYAKTYANNNNSELFFLKGIYNLATEDIVLENFCIIEDNAYFATTGNIAFNSSTINSTFPLSSGNITYSADFIGVKPCWYSGASGQFQSAINDANASNLPLWIDQKYTLDALVDFGTISKTVFSDYGKLSIVTYGSISLGELAVDNGMKDIIEATDLEFFIPTGTYRTSWFSGFNQSRLEELYNLREYKGRLIHDVDLSLDGYVELCSIVHEFKDYSLEITSTSSFVRKLYLREYLGATLESLSNISSPLTIEGIDISLDIELYFQSSSLTIEKANINSLVTSIYPILYFEKAIINNCVFTAVDDFWDFYFGANVSLLIENSVFDGCNCNVTNFPNNSTIKNVAIRKCSFNVADSGITDSGLLSIVAGSVDTLCKSINMTENSFNGFLDSSITFNNDRIKSSVLVGMNFIDYDTASLIGELARDSGHTINITNNYWTESTDDIFKINRVKSTISKHTYTSTGLVGDGSFSDTMWTDQSNIISYKISENSNTWRDGLFVLFGNDKDKISVWVDRTVGETWDGTLAEKTHRIRICLNCIVNIEMTFSDVPLVESYKYGFIRVRDADDEIVIHRSPLALEDFGVRDGQSASITINSEIYKQWQ